MLLISLSLDLKSTVFLLFYRPLLGYSFWGRWTACLFLESLRTLHYSVKFLGLCNMHVLAPSDSSPGQSAFFLLRFPVRPFSGLDGEAALIPYFFLLWLARLASSCFYIFKVVPSSYNCSMVFIRSNILLVSWYHWASKSQPYRYNWWYQEFGTACGRISLIVFSSIFLCITWRPAQGGQE